MSWTRWAGAALLAITGPAAAQPADWLLTGGRVVTQDAAGTIATGLAIAGERILAVGDAAALAPLAGPATRRVDLGGRTVIPGLIDSHIHAIRAGVRHAGEVSWIGVRSLADALGRLRAAAAAAPPGGWIVVAGGWTPSQFAEGRRPTLAELADAVGERPAYVQLFYRAVLLSSAARGALGLADEAAASAAGLRAERDPDGLATGWLAGDGSAITALYERLPHPDLAAAMEGTRRFFRLLNRHGITGVIDPGGHNLAPEAYAALFRLRRDDALTLRVAYHVSAPRPGRELDDLRMLTAFLPMGGGDAMLRFNGIGERVTWGLYNNDAPSAAQREDFVAVARWAAARGLAVTVHWNNDRSAPVLLDLFERVDRDIPLRGLRWSIAHLHDASPPTLERMRRLGVGWLMQNNRHFAAAAMLAGRGEAASREPALATALRLGLPVGAGTDADRVMSWNPFVALRWMIDGRTVDGLPTRGAAELIGRADALRLYTVGSAWFAFDETRRGTLEPGRLADLAVLDRDWLALPVAELGALGAQLTLVGGRVVHADGPFAALDPERPR